MIQKFTDEKGSITLFVLASCLFFLVSIVGVGVYIKNKQISVDEKYMQIKSTYEKDLGNEENIYNEKISTNKTGIIEVKFETQEKYLIPTDNVNVAISQKFTIKNGTNYDIKKIMYGWSNEESVQPIEWKEISNQSLSETVKKVDAQEGSYYLWVKVTDISGSEEAFVDNNAINVIKAEISIAKSDDMTAQIGYPEIESLYIYNKKVGKGENIQEAKNNVTHYDQETTIEWESGKYIYVEATDSYGNKIYKSMEME